MDNRPELNIYHSHGLGRHLIVLRSEYQHYPDPFLEKYVGKNWHVHYISINLHDGEDVLSKKLTNTLNHLQYVKNFIFDYASFLLFLKNLERIQVTYEMLGDVFIFDPVSVGRARKSFLLNQKSVYKGFLGENVVIPKFFHDEILIKTSHFKPHSAKIVGYSDPAFALKVSALVKNSLFDYSKNLDHTYRLIQKHFN